MDCTCRRKGRSWASLGVERGGDVAGLVVENFERVAEMVDWRIVEGSEKVERGQRESFVTGVEELCWDKGWNRWDDSLGGLVGS